MPKGHYDRTKKAPPIEVPESVPDAGVAIYHDRAGGPMNPGLTEGSSNFGTITESARAVVREAELAARKAERQGESVA